MALRFMKLPVSQFIIPLAFQENINVANFAHDISGSEFLLLWIIDYFHLPFSSGDTIARAAWGV